MSDITKLYVTDGGTLTLREPCKEDVLLNATLGGRSIPQMPTQEILDLLADNGILTSVVYGDKDAEENSDERYYSVTILFRAEGRVSDPPRQATSYIEAVKIACQLAIELKWIE